MIQRPPTRSGHRASQCCDEYHPFLQLLVDEGVTSYLEIGARHGDTFYDVMTRLPAGSKGVAVDLPGGAWGKSGTQHDLAASIEALRIIGYDVHMILGDSGAEDIVRQIAEFGPFDAALIDGDHRYDGVKRDWQNYGPMARLVAFHDIAGDGVVQRTSGDIVEVPRLWSELNGSHRHVEFVHAPAKMGIGVIWH